MYSIMKFKKILSGISIFILIIMIIMIMVSMLMSYQLLTFVKDVKLQPRKRMSN